MKTRAQKEDEIEVLRNEFQHSENALVLSFQGLKVADDERLRRELRAANMTYRVVKNTLAIRASEGSPLGQLKDSFTGATAVAMSTGDPVTLAKILSKWTKESQAIAVKAAVVEGRVVKAKDLEALSNLPSKEELISRMMFVINSGAQRLASVLAAVPRNLAIVIDQVKAQKQES